jgi:hypothetical protein
LYSEKTVVGYDFTKEKVNITSLSLTDIEICYLQNMQVDRGEIYLHLKEYDHAQAIYLKFKILK